MSIAGILAWALIPLVLLFQAFVTFKLWRCKAFERQQKVAQSNLVWFLPALGAIIVLNVLLDEERHMRGDTTKREYKDFDRY